MRLWFKKQEDAESLAAAKANEALAVPPVNDLAKEVAPTASASANMAAPAPSPVQAAPSVPVRPKKGQKALYYQMMNAIYDAVLILDDNGHVVDCNERVPSIFGHSREELWDESVCTPLWGELSEEEELEQEPGEGCWCAGAVLAN